jgi:EAL domain-containing protein (putative c-di-GMP-specific phosphodiesterase class I)/DNA-binding NarL/FixJ family response regulator
MGGGSCSVLVADDNVLVRDLLEAVMSGTDDFAIVASAEDAEGAGRAAAEHHPALALVDVRMPGGGPAAARAIHTASPETRIVALSSNDDPTSVRLMLAAGAVSYVVKGTPAPELLDVMRAAIAPVDPPRPRPLTGPPRRVLLALSDGVVLDELADAVMSAPGLELSGLAQTAYHAVSLAARLRPEVAVVDSTLSSGGARVAAALVAASPSTRVISWALAGEPDAGDPNVVVAADEPAGALLEAIGRAARSAAPPSASGALIVLRAPDPPSHAPARRRFERLASVLAEGRVDIQLQSIVGLADATPHGFEALARFPGHPHPGPDVWFAEAHRAEVGVELERLAVRSGLDQLHHLPGESWLAVNVSPDTAASPGLRDDLAASDPTRVVVELTEHAPVRDYDELKRALDALRELGTRVAIDDCGAGFTSLRHVALIAPDFLKLDMVLCRDVREPARAALARALVSFARETGSVVIAEGIEQRDDLTALRDLGVELGQGYLLSRPRVPEKLLTS